jgi:hypothetical protein
VREEEEEKKKKDRIINCHQLLLLLLLLVYVIIEVCVMPGAIKTEKKHEYTNERKKKIGPSISK